MLHSRLLRLAMAGGIVGGALAVAAPAAHAADQTLVSCTGSVTVAKLNPTLGSGDAHYTKIATKENDPNADPAKDVHASLTGAEDLGVAPYDSTTCTVDPGINTDNPATSVVVGSKVKDNPYDYQSNGNATLTLLKARGHLGGSATCNRVDATLNDAYPQAYPINGKLVWKFNELDAKLHNIQMQQFVRLGTDPLDTDPTHITVSGIVIKGVGVGGNVSATLAFAPTFNAKKNVNLLDCVADPAAKNASLGELLIQPADGTDADTDVDPWVISIPQN